MKRILTAVLALIPALALGTPSWATISGYTYSAVQTGATGSDSAPSGASDGANLSAGTLNEAAFEIYVCAASSQTITGGSSVDLYYYDATVAAWTLVASYTIKTGTQCVYVQGDSPGKGIPVIAKRGRVAPVLNGITFSSGTGTVYVLVENNYGSVM